MELTAILALAVTANQVWLESVEDAERKAEAEDQARSARLAAEQAEAASRADLEAKAKAAYDALLNRPVVTPPTE